MRILALVVITAIATLACSEASVATDRPLAAQPSSSTVAPSPSPSDASTPAPTEAPTPEPTESPEADVTVTARDVRGWEVFDNVNAHVVFTVENTGDTWVEMVPFESDFTIYDKSDDVVTSSSFTYAYPKYLAPGQVGYIAESPYIEGVDADDIDRVEGEVRYTEVDEEDVIVLEVVKAKNRRPEFGNGGYETTGTLKNTSDKDVESAHLGAFYLGDGGKVLGYSWTNLIENLGAGKTKGFETIGDSAPIKKSQLQQTVVLAGDDDF